MGWYIRKSKSVGPIRLNLSKSGIGVSAGVKGARISTGPRGTFVNAGGNGLYYRKKIGGRTAATSKRKARSEKVSSGKLPFRIVLLDTMAVLILLILVVLIAQITSLNTPATAIAPCLALSAFVIAALFMTAGYKQGDGRKLKTGRILLALSVCLILVTSSINSAIYKTAHNLNRFSGTRPHDTAFVVAILLTVIVAVAHIWRNLSWNLSDLPSLDDDVTAMVQKAIRRPSVSRMVAFVLLWIGALGVGYAHYDFFVVAVLGILVLLYSLISLVAYRANLNYNLDQKEKTEWKRFYEAFALLKDSKSIWAFHDVYDSDECLARRKPDKPDIINEGFVSVLRIKADCKVCFIKSRNWKYVFLPDRIIVSKGWKAVSFPLEVFSLRKSIEVAAGESKTYSDAGIHAGSMHWLHETKDGGPDLRFKDNPMSVAYELEALEFTCNEGPWIKILISKDHIRDIIYDRFDDYLHFAVTQAKNAEPEVEHHEPESPQPLAEEEKHKATKDIKSPASTRKEEPDIPSPNYATSGHRVAVQPADTEENEVETISPSEKSNSELSTGPDALYNNMLNFFDEE